MTHLPHPRRKTILALTLALLTLTVSFAGWRAQAGRGAFDRKPAASAALLTARMALVAVPMWATNLVVNSTADGTLAALNGNGTCDLREAVEAANTNAAVGECVAGMAGMDTITFSVTGTIALTAGELVIDDALTITGPGANGLTISGSNLSRVFTINGGVTATIETLTIADGRATGGSTKVGGGIANFSGTLNVINSTLSNNSASGGGGDNFGGGIYNIGTLNVINSTLSSNSASGDNSYNNGGGIANFSGTLNVINSTLSNNSASASSSTNKGGGIANFSGTLNLTSSTLSNNFASGSSSNNEGGGIASYGGTVNAKNTIIAQNTASTGPDFNGTAISQGYNLIGKEDGSTGFTNGVNQDQVGSIAMPLDPLLGPLANNGGPTQTMALLPGSPALDKGISNGLPTDQRGFARTLDFPALANATGGDGTDIGAFEFGASAVFNVQAADPAVCLDPSGLVGVTATITNGNAASIASFTATLPTGLTALAGTCAADVSPANCTIAVNGATVTWNGMLNPGQTVTIIYRARIAANVAQGTQLTINNLALIAGVPLNFNAVLTVNCPAILNARVSDQKAGSVLVFPYYTSTIGGASDTRLTISNISNAASTVANQAYVHLFFIDGTSCQQSDLFLCLTPNASFSFKASDYDPGNTGYLIAVAVNNQGVPIQNNVLIGNAFVNTPEFADNYGAESFRANSFAVATVNGDSATLYFDQVGYDAVPKQFAVEIQSPFNAAGQQVVTAGLSGNLVSSSLSGAAQVGTGLIYNGNEKPFGSFSAWLTGTCQAKGTILTNSPRVPNGMAVMVPSGQTGTMKFNVGAAVGLLLTPRTATWKGIRTLHKTQTVATTLTIPIFVPVC